MIFFTKLSNHATAEYVRSIAHSSACRCHLRSLTATTATIRKAPASLVRCRCGSLNLIKIVLAEWTQIDAAEWSWYPFFALLTLPFAVNSAVFVAKLWINHRGYLRQSAESESVRAASARRAEADDIENTTTMTATIPKQSSRRSEGSVRVRIVCRLSCEVTIATVVSIVIGQSREWIMGRLY